MTPARPGQRQPRRSPGSPRRLTRRHLPRPPALVPAGFPAGAQHGTATPEPVAHQSPSRILAVRQPALRLAGTLTGRIWAALESRLRGALGSVPAWAGGCAGCQITANVWGSRDPRQRVSGTAGPAP